MNIKQKVINLISKNEGGYTSVNRNTDGAGLSFGILQWSQRSGSLGALLEEMHKADPILFQNTFGEHSDTLLAATKFGGLGNVEGAPLWKDPWVSRFKKAGMLPTFQKVQDYLAIDGIYMQAAVKACNTIEIGTERALALMYDTSVQQGPGFVSKTAKWTKTNCPDVKSRLEVFVFRCSSHFKRNRPPSKPVSGHIEWRKVGNVWHAFAGSIDLYENVQKRRRKILSDQSLSDTLHF